MPGPASQTWRGHHHMLNHPWFVHGNSLYLWNDNINNTWGLCWNTLVLSSVFLPWTQQVCMSVYQSIWHSILSINHVHFPNEYWIGMGVAGGLAWRSKLDVYFDVTWFFLICLSACLTTYLIDYIYQSTVSTIHCLDGYTIRSVGKIIHHSMIAWKCYIFFCVGSSFFSSSFFTHSETFTTTNHTSLNEWRDEYYIYFKMR